MFLYEFLTTLFWFTLGLVLINTVAYWLPKAPTLRVHRYFLKAKIIHVFWFWLYFAVYFYSMCQGILVYSLFHFVAFMTLFGWIRWADYLKKRFLEKEIQFVQNNPDTLRLPIEKSNLSVNSVRMVIVLVVLGLLLSAGAIAYQLFRYLHHPEEYLIGGSLIAMILFSHFLFAFLNFLRLSKDDFPEITSENRDEIYRKLAECRDGKKGKLWLFSLILVCLALWILSVIAFTKTPFGDEVSHRMDADRWSSHYASIESRIITVAGPESQVKIAACENRDNFWTLVFTPLGFTGDEEGCLLYSDLIRESILLQTQKETIKPVVEPMLLAPDFLMIPFYAQLEKRNDATHYLENVVFGNSLDEPTFDTAKTALLEKLHEEKTNADVCTSKFALAARRQVVDFGNQNIVLLDDLEKADWAKFQEYYTRRFSRYQMPLVFLSGEQTPGAAIDAMERQLKPLAIDAKRKPPPRGALPDNYRATWDIEFPAIVATWPLPDPKKFPDAHGNTLLAIKTMERQLLAAPKTETHVAAVQSGLFAAPEGLIAFVSAVWEKGTPIDEARLIFESKTGKITATNSLPDWLQTERFEIAFSIAPRWQPKIHARWNSSSTRHNWGANHHRYASLLESEEQYQVLAKCVGNANFYSVQRAFGNRLTKDNRTLVILTPKE